MVTGLAQDEKRIGCMQGFLQIFDRQQIFAGKRVHSSQRLLPAKAVGAPTEIASSSKSPELKKDVVAAPAASENLKIQSKSPVSLPSTLELKDGTQNYLRKSLKDMPRLSLDSRATFVSKGSLRAKDVKINNSALSATDVATSTSVVADGDDNQHRSPSVARLMWSFSSILCTDLKTTMTIVILSSDRSGRCQDR